MPTSQAFIPSPEPGIRLKVVVARPPSDGPHPTIIFNHGSTGSGKNKALFSRLWCPPVVRDYFTQRGWMVVFPQRRGRGGSDGRYDEGLAADGTGYSCEPTIALAGFERAVADMDAVRSHLRTWSDVDSRRLIIAGVSRGGILSIAYAGMRPGTFAGAVNFNGGWLGRACPAYETVNPLIFKRGAAAEAPTLWLHGSYDQYYRLSHCRRNFDDYRAAGGTGAFVAAPTGHSLLFKPFLWRTHLDAFVDRIEKQGDE